MNESKEHIEQHLANKDINSSVSGNNVKVHSSDVAATKKHLQSAGYKTHKVVGGLNEDAEELDELSKDTLGNYIHKSFRQGNDLHYDLEHSRGNKATNAERNAMKAKLAKRNAGIIQAAQKLKEEAEELDELSNKTLDSYRAKAFADNKPENQEKRAKGRALAFDKQVHPRSVKVPATESVEELDELSKSTLGSYVNKSHDQAKRHSAAVAFKSGRGDTDSLRYGLDGARKAGNRDDGIKTAIKKLTKESAEELDETNKFVNVATSKRMVADAEKALADNPNMFHGAKTGFKRQITIHKKHIENASSKLTKEDTMLTYSEFMEKLQEGKIDDLKDRLAAAREKRLSNYDFSKEKEKPKSNVTTHYAKTPEVRDDEEETARATSGEKRGRGRPKGTKSGARI